jgi:hypothetical protein
VTHIDTENSVKMVSDTIMDGIRLASVAD